LLAPVGVVVHRWDAQLKEADQGVGIKGSQIPIVALDSTCIEIVVHMLRRQSTKELF